MKISLGVGLTTKCNCNCKHCYSRNGEDEYLDFKDLKEFCNIYDISMVNFGTGESIFHPELGEIITYFHGRNIPMSLTSNGYTVSMLSDNQLKMLNDIDFSLDFPDEKKHDTFRGDKRFICVCEGIKRCKNLSIECSIACCLMNNNNEYIIDMIEFCRKLDVNLRLNIYKPVTTDRFKLSYDQFWSSIEALFKNSEIISCSEPIICMALADKPKRMEGSPCGKNSLRIKPSGIVVPCVYLSNSDIHLKDLIEFAKENDKDQVFKYLNASVCFNEGLPIECIDCEYKDECRGGCLSRRILNGGNSPDEYCFVKRSEKKQLVHKWANKQINLVHSDYLCTIIVKP